jgi:hypothetical protein
MCRLASAMENTQQGAGANLVDQCGLKWVLGIKMPRIGQKPKKIFEQGKKPDFRVF